MRLRALVALVGLLLGTASAWAATPSFVQGTGDTNSGLNDYSENFASNVTAGNAVYMLIRVEHGATVSAVTFPGAQTPSLLDSCTSSCANSKDYYLYRTLSATGGGAAVAFHNSVTTNVAFSAVEYANVGSEQAYATFASLSTSTTQTCPATTADAANEMAVSFFAITNAITMNPNNGETERQDDTRDQIEEKLTAGAGSVANQILLGSTSVAECSQVLLKGTAAGTGKNSPIGGPTAGRATRGPL